MDGDRDSAVEYVAIHRRLVDSGDDGYDAMSMLRSVCVGRGDMRLLFDQFFE